MITIIQVTLEDDRIDCKVTGSSLSVEGYGRAFSMAVRGVAKMFAEHSKVDEKTIVQEIIKVIDEDPTTIAFQAEKLH